MTIYSFPNVKGKLRWYYQFQYRHIMFRGGGYPSKTECLQAEAKRRIELTNPEKLTFKDICTKYFESISYQTPRWINEKQNLIKRWFEGWYPIPIGRITTGQIEEHLNKRKASAVTVNMDLIILKSIFNFARKRGWINKNPCDLIQKRPENQLPRYVPTLEDFKKVLSVAKPADKSFLLVLFLTGGRIGEILNLRWKDITDNYLTLYSRKHRYGDLKSRQIPLSPLLKEILASIPKENEFVFYNSRTGTRYIYRPSLLENLCRKAEVKSYGYHSIRALSASILSATRTPLKDISELLGHSNLSTTQIYLRSLGLREATEKLAEIIR
jgi:integrase